MIEHHYELDFKLDEEARYSDWAEKVVASEGRGVDCINYIFCDDEYLWELNHKYLNHNELTDILTFDYSEGERLRGDVFISVERVRENAKELAVQFDHELLRVMSHGLLHMLGYHDNTAEQQRQMRSKEDEKIKMFHVER